MQVAAGLYHTLLLRSDSNGNGQRNSLALDGQLRYRQVVAGALRSVLARSDDKADGQCNILALYGQLRYMQVAAGWYHTLLLRSVAMAMDPATLWSATVHASRIWLVSHYAYAMAMAMGGAPFLRCTVS